MSGIFDISDRLALVTGSSRGLGRSLALALADAGARVIVHGRDAAAVEDTRAQVEQRSGRPAHALTFDVTSPDEVMEFLGAAVGKYGVPDILVNNAGIQRRAPIQDFSVDDWDGIVAANLSSAFYVSRALLPHMVGRESGKIINIASVQSLLARQTIAPYSATKGGRGPAHQGNGRRCRPFQHPGQCALAGLFRHGHEPCTR